jgi:hypothetical protein
MLLVLDRRVVVAAVRSRRGASDALLIRAFEGELRWTCSVPLFFEYEDVLYSLMVAKLERGGLSARGSAPSRPRLLSIPAADQQRIVFRFRVPNVRDDS